ncbi:TetR/AcrR family transcriptional regulator C-terminal domain-containing protein [Demequina sp. B12]|uniref:TetR/AcrR family transcriptional regulator C-terminal domain-containing protein n=1 Tax=Demequina sp. B12 TaxID=2992757 RepID=UPI00237A5278|nr:TetR/AcrR family transcriptional regulator C-terminal domain-containing protein [Demequina sp. B12]MDE0573122.1 TetR/AcrR family transcriptional regulator C-terminal domain-containing protein [Demequina sp. B12]
MQPLGRCVMRQTSRPPVASERRSGQTELGWWQANAAALGDAMGEREFPLASRVGQAAGAFYQAATDPDRQFRFGLDTVVAGLLRS